MTIQIRVDDYPGTKPAEFYRHNRVSFEKFDDVMQECMGGKKYLLGVIPAHTSDEDLEWLSERNLVIGMHGTDHDERFQNQFGDRFTTAEVEALLDVNRKRLQRLAKQPVDTYMPPHNVFDEKTVRACREVGFKAVTSGPESGMTRSLRASGICYLHSRQPLEYGRSDELLQRGAVEHLLAGPRACSFFPTYLSLHFPWEVNLDNGFSTLRTLLTSIKEHVVDFSI